MKSHLLAVFYSKDHVIWKALGKGIWTEWGGALCVYSAVLTYRRVFRVSVLMGACPGLMANLLLALWTTLLREGMLYILATLGSVNFCKAWLISPVWSK